MNNHVKNITYCAMFACIIAIMSQIKITLPGLVPITLQTLAVYIVACLQKPKQAAISTFVYVVLGSVGVPIFAGFTGGLSVLFGPTGGYIFSFPLMAAVSSLIINKKDSKTFHFVALIVGTILCYSLGTAWFMYVTGNSLLVSLVWCVFPFILGDMIKMVLATIFSKKVSKYVNYN
jgi:biotin transport system substrate-specific component